MVDNIICDILRENDRRNKEIYAPFNPITGFGSVGIRHEFHLPDFPIPTQYLPAEMCKVPLVKRLKRLGSIEAFLASIGADSNDRDSDRLKVIQQFVRLRCRYDFPFWAATFVYIKNKGGGEDVLFRLTRPQRKFVDRLEQLRIANRPIRLILLKARQWGGSTTSQLYMAWLQLIHKVGLNSLIIAHQGAGSDEIKDMFDRMIKNYPTDMLHKLGDSFNENEPKLVGVGKSGSIHRVPQRNCKIKIGTAERPDSCRGGDYNLVHLSEVGVWKTTEGKKPEDIVRSACSGVLLRPYTMIVYESTANGTGNFFYNEYNAAVDPKVKSQFEAMFISWFDIEQYSTPFASEHEKLEFAKNLFSNKDSNNINSSREEPGKYLWWLWEKGATLEAINWYIDERAGKNDHGTMASEYPSDDIEAFVHSGKMVFDKYNVEKLKPSCRPPKFIGEVYADADNGPNALLNLRFINDNQGLLHIWELPEPLCPKEKDKFCLCSQRCAIWNSCHLKYNDDIVCNRYLTVVDIGGRSNKADFSVILVIDRLFMADGGKPSVVAQWYGHIDIDLLAWKATQIAAFYDNSLLVIESNTLETHDKERDVDGDQSHFILNQIKDVYPNLYARKQSEEAIREGLPIKYGFHTNIATKPMIISTLIKVIRENLYVERDNRCLDEYLCYEKKPNGAFGAITDRHDDLLMTRAIGLHICFFEMETPSFIQRNNRLSPKKNKIISEATI